MEHEQTTMNKDENTTTTTDVRVYACFNKRYTQLVEMSTKKFYCL